LSNLITQKAAADIAGVSKQAIGDIKKKKTYNFFVGTKVDIDSSSWNSYLQSRKSNGAKVEVKSQLKDEYEKESKHEDSEVLGEEKEQKKDYSVKSAAARQENALTGGYDPGMYVPGSIADIKKLTEIEKLRIEMEVRLNNLIDREMVISIIETMSQAIQGHFVDLGRRTSSLICSKLEKQGYEKVVEDVINPMIEQGIKDIKKKAKDSLEIKINE
jgi:hypothetical protein